MIEETVERWGRIDVLFNNAGVLVVKTIDQMSEEEWDRVMAVNIKAAFLAAKHVVPHMRRIGGGVILNTGFDREFHRAGGHAGLFGVERRDCAADEVACARPGPRRDSCELPVSGNHRHTNVARAPGSRRGGGGSHPGQAFARAAGEDSHAGRCGASGGLSCLGRIGGDHRDSSRGGRRVDRGVGIQRAGVRLARPTGRL